MITKEQREAWVMNYIKENHTLGECDGFIDGVEKAMEAYKNQELNEDVVSNKSLPTVVMSEERLNLMAELNNPKVTKGRSDFHLAWRLCYEWMCSSAHLLFCLGFFHALLIN